MLTGGPQPQTPIKAPDGQFLAQVDSSETVTHTDFAVWL